MLKPCACGWDTPATTPSLNKTARITKMRENCLKQFDEHWNCLEANNQVAFDVTIRSRQPLIEDIQEYYRCRKPERTLNKCMFEKLVCLFSYHLAHDHISPTSNDTQGLTKTIPGSPPNQKQIHEVESPIFTGVQK